MRANAVKALEGPWIITCDKRGTRFQVRLTASGIENLLKLGKVVIKCQNPIHVDKAFFTSSRHKVEITLRGLVGLVKHHQLRVWAKRALTSRE